MPQLQGGDEQGRGSLALPQEQDWMLVLEHGEQEPGWQVSGQVWTPQERRRPHTEPQLQADEEQRLIVGEDLPQ